jgi:uncharacterized protein YegP (UPF0339 family)
MAKFEIFRDTSDKYRFHLTAANGEIVAASEAYASKAGAQSGIDFLKRESGSADTIDLT